MDNLSTYVKRLMQAVINKSEADDWKSAVTEWSISDVEEDDACSGECICGHEQLRYLFTIKNTINGNILYPIGSSCIKRFERNDLSEEVSVMEKLFKLLHAIEGHEFITLSSELFSKKLLYHLYKIGAFKPTSYNGYNPSLDYQFMLDMFNKRNHSDKQEKKATAIILNSIRPFLQDMLKDKIKKDKTS